MGPGGPGPGGPPGWGPGPGGPGYGPCGFLSSWYGGNSHSSMSISKMDI